MRRAFGAPVDINTSIGGGLDASMLSCDNIDTTARLDSRKSLSSSQFGRNSFIKPGAPPSAKKSLAVPGRPSLMPGGDRRLSAMTGRPTLGGGGGLAAKRADLPDPRPLNSAAWKAEASQKVFDFLTETAYPQRVSTKLLLGPTAKDFQAIITHIARTLDGHYVMAGKLEDEVAALAKALNYPFTPSKTAIATVGAAHSWPPLLGFLVWMSDLARYHLGLRTKQEEEEEALAATAAAAAAAAAFTAGVATSTTATASGRPSLSHESAAAAAAAAASVVGTPSHFWWYLRETYSAYLAGEDDIVEGVEAAISSAFDGAARAGEGEVAAAEAAAARTARTLEALAGEAGVLPALRAAAGEVEGDCGRLRAALAEMEAYGESLGRKRGEKGGEVGALEREVAAWSGEIARLEGVVAGQEMSQEDLRRLKARGGALKERRAAIALQMGELEKEVAMAKEELRRRVAGLESRLRDYHEKARGLQLVPRGAKWSAGVDFTLRLEESALERVTLGGRSGSGSSSGMSSSSGSEGEAALDDGGERRAASNELLGGVDMKGVIKTNLRFLKTSLVKAAGGVRAGIAGAGEEVEGGLSRREACLKALEAAMAGVAGAEAGLRREAEAGEVAAGAAAAAAGEARKTAEAARERAMGAASGAGELGPGVLVQLGASIDAMEGAQVTERQRLSDLVARCLLRVSEHKQGARTRLDGAAAAVIAAKQRVGCVEAEREARLRGGGIRA